MLTPLSNLENVFLSYLLSQAPPPIVSLFAGTNSCFLSAPFSFSPEESPTRLMSLVFGGCCEGVTFEGVAIDYALASCLLIDFSLFSV